jgi:hypothetical protein
MTEPTINDNVRDLANRTRELLNRDSFKKLQQAAVQERMALWTLRQMDEQNQWGFMKLPVVSKDVRYDPAQRKHYYVNAKGNRTFLNRKQVEQCRQGNLQGAYGGCGDEFRGRE